MATRKMVVESLPPETGRLAIVIPFYKAAFFDELLAALAAQTDPRFVVYVGDDCSPTPPEAMIARYKDQLDITYHRFETNLGGADLAGQWNRCLDLIPADAPKEGADWVWMLPDDDLPSPECVAEINAAIAAHTGAETGAETGPPPGVLHMDMYTTADPAIDPGPPLDPDRPRWTREDNLRYYNRLLRSRGAATTLGTVIYPLARLRARRGFVSFPKGWGSDHATLLLCAQPGGIVHLGAARLLFRQSGENISSRIDDGAQKMAGRVAFAQWLRANPQVFETPPDPAFYAAFYWKGEFYAAHVWPVELGMLRGLWALQGVCLPQASVWVRLKSIAMVLRAHLKAPILSPARL